MTSISRFIPGDLAEALTQYVAIIVQRVWPRTQDADRRDLVQDVLVVLLVKLATSRPPEELSAWLRGVVRNLGRLRRRERTRRRWVSPYELQSDGSNATAEPAAQSDAWVALGQTLDAVSPPLAQEERAWLLALAAGESRQSIADHSGETPDRIERRVRKVLERLRKFIESGN